MLWEDREIESLVFDKRSLKALSRIIKKGIITEIVGKIAEGKEASVFLATREGQERVIKIYKPETSKFFNSRKKYINREYNSDFEIAVAYARKEFKNLEIAYSTIHDVPIPIYQEDNIIVMSFLGENRIPYPKLHDIKTKDERWFDELLDKIHRLFRAGYIHGDLSEYNILVGDRLYIIDFGQSVRFDPKLVDLLIRDVSNLGRIFHRDVTGVVDRWISEL